MKFTRRATGSATVAALVTTLAMAVSTGTANAVQPLVFQGFGTGQCMVANMSVHGVQVNQCAAFPSQAWELLPMNTVAPDGAHEFQLRNVPTGNCARAGDTSPHGSLLLSACDPNDPMTIWDQTVSNLNDPQQFRLKGFNVCIDRPSEFHFDGENMQVYTCNLSHDEQLINVHP